MLCQHFVIRIILLENVNFDPEKSWKNRLLKVWGPCVQLLLHRFGVKPKQASERTEKQEGTIVCYF